MQRWEHYKVASATGPPDILNSRHRGADGDDPEERGRALLDSDALIRITSEGRPLGQRLDQSKKSSR